MAITDRAQLEQIAAQIGWPEAISDYLLNLRDNLSEEIKVEAITQSLWEDGQWLKRKYFPGYAGKNVQTLEQYARQRNWTTEQKVHVGAINGVLLLWAMIDAAITAASWGSTRLSSSPASIIKYAIGLLPAKEVNLETLTSSQLRAGRLACDLLEKGEGITYERIANPNHFRVMSALARKQVEQRRGNWEETQKSQRRDAMAVKGVREEVEYLRQYAILWEQDPTGKLFATKAVEKVKNEPLGRKAELHPPFAIGKAVGAAQASKLYIERYDLLH